ncbi:hypothetical protein T03_13330 [Trichinella britovi]|uniref:BLOC-1-related complex subunit 6 C-terminal helix domain-containing protein n=1 Tax=Trichinella britovi TaxID=45882 RepID=A0A0V1CH78_TRIBR|nr:hypothetical protein T03_13330 [Trichinella britovi]
MSSNEESTNYNWQLEIVSLMNTVNNVNVSVANSLDEMSEITEQLALLLKDTTSSACDSADSAVRNSFRLMASMESLSSKMQNLKEISIKIKRIRLLLESLESDTTQIHLASLMANHSNTSFENRELAKHVRVVDSDMPTKVIMASAKIGLWALKRKISVEEISRLIVNIFSKTTKDSSWGCIVGKNVVLGTEFFGMYFMHFIIDDYTFFVFHKRNVY